MPNSLNDNNRNNNPNLNDFLTDLKNKKDLSDDNFVNKAKKNSSRKQKKLAKFNKSTDPKPSINKKLIPNVTDDYDSTGHSGKTDESCNSSHDDEEIPGINQSKPVDIKNRIRGILKYPPGWPRRAFSESDTPMVSMLRPSDSFSNSDFDYGYYGTSIESPEITFDCFEYNDDDDGTKPKKCVTFADKQSTYVFRPGSSILGRRHKNQKKAQKKKERELKKSASISDEGSLPKSSTNEIEDVKIAIELQREYGINHFEDDDFCDDASCSSTDDALSSESGCDSSSVDISASDCSSADELSTADQIEESCNDYIEEFKDKNSTIKSSKSKRKNLRRRNRDKKFQRQIYLETGGYDSD